MNRNRIEVMLCVSVIALAFSVSLGSSSEAAPAMMVQPMMPWSQPNVFEQYGPRLDNIHYVFTGSPEDSFMMLDYGDVDIIDWALSKSWKDSWEDPARTDIKVMGYGGEYGYYVLDVREDPSKPVAPPFSTQSYCLFGDPTSVSISLAGEDPYTCTRAAAARRAVAHVIDRTWIVSTVMGGLGEPIYVPSPAAHGGFNNPYVAKYYQDFDKARTLLDDAGVVDTYADGDDWREIPGTGENLVLDFFIKIGYPTEQIGNRIAADIEGELRIQVNEQYGGSDIAFPHVMVSQEMDLYTGYWSDIQYPDHYLNLYSQQGWWPAGSYCPNYMKYCGPYSSAEHFDPEVESCMDSILSSLDVEDVKAAVWAVQEVMQRKDNVYTIPLVSTAAPKAWRTYKKGTAPEPGNEWKGIVNQTAQGVNNWWTFLSAHTDNQPDSGTMTYGLSYVEIDFLNPIYASQPQSWEILDKIYDSMLHLDPIDRVTMEPWVAQEWMVEYDPVEYDPVQGKYVTTLYCKVRNDVYWHDGEQLTADDVIFTLEYLPDMLEERGYPPPSWYGNVRNIYRTEKFNDFYFMVYMDSVTYWALRWVGLNIILPEHVWKDIVDTGDPDNFCPDPTLTGSGPYQMDESDYVAGVSADVYAYKPGSVGYFQYTPIQVELDPVQTLVGDEKVGIYVRVDNYKLGTDITVTVTLEMSAESGAGPYTTIGAKVVTAPRSPSGPPGIAYVMFVWPLPYSPTHRIFKATATWATGLDLDTAEVVSVVTVLGDITNAGDTPGDQVNIYDAVRMANNWGPTGPWRWANADVNTDGTVNIYDAVRLMGNWKL